MLEKRKPLKKKRLKFIPLSRLTKTAFLSFFLGTGVGFGLYSFYNELSPPVIVLNDKSTLQACFSPEGYCTDRIVSAIETANVSILIMSYSFTSAPIASALVKALERGVNVKVLVDKSQVKGKYTQIPYLSQSGVPIFVDSVPGIAHNKTMIIDDRIVLTGSFNWTNAAESRNAENILFIKDLSLAQIYKKNWKVRESKATKIDLKP